MKRSIHTLVLRVGATLAAAGCVSALALTVSAGPAHPGSSTPARSVSVLADASTPVASPSPTPAPVDPGEWNSTD